MNTEMLFNVEHDREMLPFNSVKIDGEKMFKFLEDNHIKHGQLALDMGYSRSFIRDVTRRGWINRAGLKVFTAFVNEYLAEPISEDYFIVKETEPETTKEPETVKESEHECLIDLADIQLSFNKVESLLLAQNSGISELLELIRETNRLLRGKLVKNERSNEAKGDTNSGASHSYTVNGIRPVL